MFEWMVKGAIVLVACVAALTLLRRAPAALRRALLGAALLGTAAIPLLPGLLPAWPSATRVDDPLPELAADALFDDATPVAAAAPLPSAPRTSPAFDWLPVLWGLGALMLLIRLAADHARARAVRRRARRGDLPDAWRLPLERAGRPLAVRWSDEIDTPMLAGVWRPVLLLPETARDWSETRAAACLAHELAHFAGHDTRLLFAADLLRALRWPDPLAWWAARRLRSECEHVADDAALLAGARPAEYAEFLLALAARRTSGRATVGAAGGGVEQRIDAVLRRVPRRAPRPMAALGAAVGALIAAAVGCVGPDEAVAGASAAGASAAGASAAGASAAGASAALSPGSGEPATPDLAAGRDEVVQAKVHEELLKLESPPVAASVVVVDPLTGAVLAFAGSGPHGDATPLRPVEPASLVKPLLAATALEAGVDPTRAFDTAGGRIEIDGQAIVDATPTGALNLEGILVHSSNVGAARLAQGLGPDAVRAGLGRFRLAPADDRALSPALAATGLGLRASPVQVALAYAALAGDGFDPVSGDRVVSAETARAVREMLAAVVDQGTGRRAALDEARVGGKTATTRTVGPDGQPLIRAAFVGLVPADAPRWIIHVQVDTRAEGATGGTVAAPLFRRIALSLLRDC